MADKPNLDIYLKERRRRTRGRGRKKKRQRKNTFHFIQIYSVDSPVADWLSLI